MKIAFVLGEESADRIGADLLRSLRLHSSEPVAAVGLAGDALKREGMASLFDIEELSIVGVGAIVGRLPQLLRRLRQTVDFVLQERPDVVVTLDSYTFTNRVARRVKARWPEALIVNVVPPAIWAYRPERAAHLAETVAHSICLFPFEPDAMREHGGPPATYVGHPLLSDPHLIAVIERDRLAGPRPASIPPHLVILPGSRRGEVRRLMKDFGATLDLLTERVPGLTATLPTIPRVRVLVERHVAEWRVKPRIVESNEEKWAAFASADAALAASGTVSLELALASVPMALAYRLDPLGYLLRHLVTGWTAALPNFVAGHPLVPEHFHELIRPEALARRLERLLAATPERDAQIQGFIDIRRRMEVPLPPGEAAAGIILRLLGERSGRGGPL